MTQQPPPKNPNPEVKATVTAKPPAATAARPPLATTSKTPTTSETFEKISGIVAPYFIVLVGLYLYDNDFILGFMLGTILISVGIVLLLKISFDDVKKFIDWGKKSLGYGKEPNNNPAPTIPDQRKD